MAKAVGFGPKGRSRPGRDNPGSGTNGSAGFGPMPIGEPRRHLHAGAASYCVETNFPAAAEEATLSRIFAGVHFLFDLTTGQRLGSDIADFIVDNFLTSRDRDA